MSTFLTVAIAIFLDRLFGELPIYHPLRGFARFAIFLEDNWHKHENTNLHTAIIKEEPTEKTNEPNHALETATKIKGVLAVIFLVLPFVSLTAILSQSLVGPLNFIFDILVLYLIIGAHSLKQHALDVQSALINDNLELAQRNLALMVNRDTKQMDRQQIVSTCVESIVESGSEAILGPILWFVMLGAPAAVLFGLVHILNTMWGYQSPHYKDFGWAIGKVNNVLNWIPARIAAFTYIVLGDMKNGWRCFNEQARNWNSPNAELVIAVGAGSLNLEIGGDIYYQGQLIKRPKLGMGKLPDLSDIARACDLIDRSTVLWLALVLIFSLSHL